MGSRIIPDRCEIERYTDVSDQGLFQISEGGRVWLIVLTVCFDWHQSDGTKKILSCL